MERSEAFAAAFDDIGPGVKSEYVDATVTDMARRALAQCDNDVVRSGDLLAKWLEQDAERFATLRDALVRRYAGRKILDARTDLARQRWRKDSRGKKGSGLTPEQVVATIDDGDARRKMIQLAAGNAGALLKFILPIGMALGDATADQVREGASVFLKAATTADVKGRWLAAIAAKMPPKKTVAQCFDETALKAIREKVIND